MTDERKDQLTAEADGLIEGRNAVIEALRTELQSLREQMNTGKQETDESIQTMAAVNSTQQTELNTSKGLATAGLCLSGVSLLGNIALLIAYLQKKRKQ